MSANERYLVYMLPGKFDELVGCGKIEAETPEEFILEGGLHILKSERFHIRETFENLETAAELHRVILWYMSCYKIDAVAFWDEYFRNFKSEQHTSAGQDEACTCEESPEPLACDEN